MSSLFRVRYQSVVAQSVGSCIRLFSILGPPADQFEVSEQYSDDRPSTPWVRQVVSGVSLMRNPKYNKGLAFMEAERDRLYLRGLLPAAVLDQEVQVERAMINVRQMTSDLDRNTYLQNLLERNERLYYRVLLDHFEELLPIINVPTIRMAAQKYGLMFRSLPRGLYISLHDKGHIHQILKNWPERKIKVVIITDGEQVGVQGDLGVHAITVAISKLALYTGAGGINPAICLPICIDVGTDNEEFLKESFYVGLKHRRIKGEAYQSLLDELVSCIYKRYGNNVFVHYEDMAASVQQEQLTRFRGQFPCYSDDLQGISASILAGIYTATKKKGSNLAQERILCVGEGQVTVNIAELISSAISEEKSCSILEARESVNIVDSKGLIVRSRGNDLEDYKLPFCHDHEQQHTLLDAIKLLKPTVLVGHCSNDKTSFPFTKQICEEMSKINQNPIIFPIQLPGDNSTCAEIFEWTEERVLLAWSPGHYENVQLNNGRTVHVSQCHTAYLYPGVAMGCLLARSTRLRNTCLLAAARTISEMVSEEELKEGRLFPRPSRIREIGLHVAKTVAQNMYDLGDATQIPKPYNLLKAVDTLMYRPNYRIYR
eukprot:TRINITY_DN16466_c0_g1_i4.p1 TRINITY_DN16466_c0_g1~~TRINITY_DN16466_c0_g1_i4.p1  ORF type:complete len:623 (+),score=90.32 TRINITY_DN16466_c0_g1_i4:72-1871(+)